MLLQKYLNIKEYCSIVCNVALHIQTVGVVGPVVRICVYIGPGAQSEDIK